LTYACPIWGGAAKTHINKLEIVQNKYLRKALKAPWFIRNEQILYELNILPLKSWILHLSDQFYASLPSSPAYTSFQIGKTVNSFPRIKSRYSKDLLHPP